MYGNRAGTQGTVRKLVAPGVQGAIRPTESAKQRKSQHRRDRDDSPEYHQRVMGEALPQPTYLSWGEPGHQSWQHHVHYQHVDRTPPVAALATIARSSRRGLSGVRLRLSAWSSSTVGTSSGIP